jgi:hypothetical protein
MAVTLDDINELGVRAFDVYIYHYGDEETYETLCFIGTAEDIVYGMDTYLTDNVPDDDWGEYWAGISYAGVDLVCMPDLDGPYYDVVVDDEEFEGLLNKTLAEVAY